MLRILFLLVLLGFSYLSEAVVPHREFSVVKPKVYRFEIRQDIFPSVGRIVDKAFDAAEAGRYDLVLIHMNTYGGAVDVADSVRTRILNATMPVWVFVDRNAISAGALIAIAADRIYMREGAHIGAATVVNQTGSEMPDKYQAFMRSMMRSTAESHGKDTLITASDTLITWRRDPRIAEAMVDPRVHLEGIADSGKVLTLTTNEAIKVGYCEGIASSPEEVLRVAGVEQAEVTQHKITGLDSLIGWLLHPVVRGLLIILIFGGIYFEIQSPGIGFALVVALSAAFFYFAPLWLEGLAEHWEIALFLAGLALLGVEIFVLPGFGVAGISGIVLIITGLTLSLVDNTLFTTDFSRALLLSGRALLLVVTSVAIAFLLGLWAVERFFRTTRLKGVTLRTEQLRSEGFVGVNDMSELVGKQGISRTLLRPAGKVEMDGVRYDAISLYGYIEKDSPVEVVRQEAGTLYVRKLGD